MSDQEAIEAHNAREMWRDVGNHLVASHESLERAQAGLEDLGKSAWADQLQPLVDAIRRAANDAAEAA
jgi:hypothetical protein